MLILNAFATLHFYPLPTSDRIHMDCQCSLEYYRSLTHSLNYRSSSHLLLADYVVCYYNSKSSLVYSLILRSLKCEVDQASSLEYLEPFTSSILISDGLTLLL